MAEEDQQTVEPKSPSLTADMSGMWVALVFLFSTKRVLSSEVAEDAANSVKRDESKVGGDYAGEIVKRVIARGCAKKYTMTCFKMDMVHLVDLLSARNVYQLFPGIAVLRDVSSEASTNKKLPDKLVKTLASEFPLGHSPELDDFLVDKIVDYLSTHSVRLKLMASQNQSLVDEGRGKGNKGYGSLMAGVMMMKGTLMTIGFGALAALAGKALMTGLLSLMLSAIIGLRSANGTPQRQTTYEIISKPLYTHSHSHSSELSHDHHDHGHSSYSYGRNLDFDDEHPYTKSEVEYVQLPAREEEEEERDRPHQGHYNYNSYGNVEYKTITEDDLKAYYNNLDYGNGRGHSPVSYRAGKGLKSFPEGTKSSAKGDSSLLVPVTASLKPDVKALAN